MSTAAYVLFIFMMIGGFALMISAFLENPNVSGYAITGALFFLFPAVIFIIAACKPEPKPQAIDVYRGKTTLQVLYQD